jgi:hypothetical protein
MIAHPALKTRLLGGIFVLLGGLTVYASFTPAVGGGLGQQEMPGPLSAVHVPKPGEADCSACHVAPGKVAPSKCLACHTEIASRIAAEKGYHRDKADDCAVCHAEHQGRQANIVPLEKESFDHSETGAKLQGTHLKLKDCDKCHTPSNTLPRAKGKSYLFKDSGCRSCHTPPHPGNQDKCVDCHNQESWIVERHGAEG